MPPRSALPALDARRHMERAAATRLMVAHETALERHLARVISAAGRTAARHFTRSGEKGALNAIRVSGQMIARVLRPSIRATAREFGQRVVSQAIATVGGKSAHHRSNALETKAFEDLDAEIDRFLTAHTAERVVQISDSLRAQIAQIIRRGLEEKQGVEEVAQAIVEATSGEMSMGRARRIARTETHTAANAGQLAAARASPLAFRKRWLATEDKRTREDHAEANGQTVDLDEPFIVGGVEMMMPGDPTAPPEQTINCRCTVQYIPITEPQPGGEDVEPGELLEDVDLWRAFFAELQAQQQVQADVVLYASGPDCGLPMFASAEDLQAEVGQEIAAPRTASVSPILLNGGAGLQDTFPLYGRPVVVKITVPAGTTATAGSPVGMEVRLAEDVRVVVTAVTEDTWGDVQDVAGVPIDQPPARARRRLPPKRGVTLVEAEVQE